MKYIYILLLLLITPKVIIAQDSEAFNDLHRQVMSELATSDIDYAFSMVDSLRALATSEKDRIKADQVLSYLHYQKGDKVTALTLAMENEERFRKNRDYTEQLGVIGFIASNFKELQLYSEAVYYLNKAEKSLNRLPNANLKAQFSTLIYHEKVDVSLDMGKLRDAEKYIKKAYQYVDNIEVEHVRNYFLAVTLERDAVLAFKKKLYDRASRLNLEALDALESKEEILYGAIHLNLARIALINKTYDIAHQHLLEAGNVANSSQFFSLQKRLHKTYVDYYTALDLDEERLKHESIHASLIESEMEEVGISANLALLKMRAEVNRYRYGLWTVIGISFLVILLFIGVIYYRKRILKSKEDPDSVIEEIEVAAAENTQVYTNENIAKKTEDRILAALTNLEKEEKFFLTQDLSIAGLANDLDTNTKYLSYVIRKYRDKNFNGYINDLRIDYVVSNLSSNPKFRKYKISYLAKLAGFSSHSKFSSEFRRKIGKSPSKYIKLLDPFEL